MPLSACSCLYRWAAMGPLQRTAP